MKRLLCLILCMALMLPCMGTSVFAEGENLNVIASIAQYHVTGAVLPGRRLYRDSCRGQYIHKGRDDAENTDYFVM